MIVVGPSGKPAPDTAYRGHSLTAQTPCKPFNRFSSEGYLKSEEGFDNDDEVALS